MHVHGNEDVDFIPFDKVKGGVFDKLTQLRGIHDKRLSEPQDSPQRMEDVCNLIPDSLEDTYLGTVGYHRRCYRAFTKKPRTV